MIEHDRQPHKNACLVMHLHKTCSTAKKEGMALHVLVLLVYDLGNLLHRTVLLLDFLLKYPHGHLLLEEVLLLSRHHVLSHDLRCGRTSANVTPKQRKVI